MPRSFAKAKFVRGVAILAGGSALAQGIPVLLTPLLVRLYSPSDMGILALYLAFISFVSTATTLGYSLSIVAASNIDEAADLTLISGFAVIPFATLASLLFWLLIEQSWLGFGNLSPISVFAMWISLLLTGVYFTTRYWLLRQGSFRTISLATVSQSVGRGAGQVALGILSLGSSGLVTGEILGRCLGLRSLWRATWQDVSPRSLPLDHSRLRAVAFRYWKFPVISAPSALLNSLALVLPVPLIAAQFGLSAAGQFSIASRVLLVPLVLVGTSIGDVFHNRIATYSRTNPKMVMPLFLKVSATLLLLGLLPLTIVGLWGETLWLLILGDEWNTAGLVASALVPWALMQFAVSPVSRVVTVFDGQELKLVYDALSIASISVAFILSSRMNWTLIEACSWLGVSQAVVYGFYFLLLLRIVKSKSYEGPLAAPKLGDSTL